VREERSSFSISSLMQDPMRVSPPYTLDDVLFSGFVKQAENLQNLENK
jgi:hypothetical protein